MSKKRFELMLDPKQLIELQKISDVTGAPVAELIRRAIDAYLRKVSGK